MTSTPKRSLPGCDSGGMHSAKRQALLSPENQRHSSRCADTEDSPATISTLSDESHMICFGMLCDVQIQLNSIQPEHLLDLRTHWSDHENFKILDVLFNRTHCIIQTPNATPIALLNLKTHRALTVDNEDSSSLFCIGLVRQEDLEQVLITSTSIRSSKSHQTTCSMDMIICGPQQIRHTLSRSLSKSRLFLQHPRFIPDHSVYDNPQYLGLPGSKLSEGAILRPLLLDPTMLDMQQKSAASSESAQVVDAEDIFSHIPIQNDLKEAEIDESLVKTKLLRYECPNNYPTSLIRAQGIRKKVSASFFAERHPHPRTQIVSGGGTTHLKASRCTIIESVVHDVLCLKIHLVAS
ncbi:hypothetical protein BJ166DRAFT_328909 [Pestalotiopsis sp. NC0098]|nr:hypothetical protein BJ166DRAFT_328909 [Pestalotiopsis sp. NC0098]